MAIEVKMPALSPTMEEGKLARWLVKEGDEVSSGDILAEIETDKATMEFEAVDEGTVGKIVIPEGTEGVKVGTVIALIAGEGEDVSDAGEAKATDRAGSSSKDEQRQSDAGNSSKREAPEQQMKAEESGTDKGDSKLATGAAQLSSNVAPAAAPEIPAGTNMKTATVREALRDAMAEEMRRDDRVFVMGEEVAEYQGAYKVTQGLLDEFGPQRVIDTPITEYGFAGIGTGAAMGGLRPIVEFMTFNFAMQAIDHIINSAAKTNYMSGGQMRCPVVFRGPNGAAARVGAQHSQNYAPWYASVPGLVVIAPYDASDAKGLLKAAIRSEDPVVFLENELVYGRSFELPELDDHVLPIGKARVVREGSDVTIVSYSIGVGVSLEAAEQLAAEGIEAEVLDLRTLRPLDKAAVLKSLKKTNRLVVAEEGFPVCSIASEIIAICMEEGFDDLDAPVLRVCDEDVPLPYAANLEKAALIDTARVVEAVKKVCYR
ncbi:pyruvate dehydrogenase complex E1 component subunit beta [Novosphingobium sp. M1R2S20]|uniref:Pyruvate dehydrogenase E1 component subunit beta n=1 Tax=Novosphingobium rhizovicinum TaxID=3228928 RepID=A0ABV3RCG1_9SPHN